MLSASTAYETLIHSGKCTVNRVVSHSASVRLSKRGGGKVRVFLQ